MIKAIIFDCFGVLTGDLWKEFVLSLPEDQRSGARDLNRALDSGFISQDEFYEKISELTGEKPDRIESVINSEMSKNTKLFSYIKELKNTYKIGLLSNVSTDWVTSTFLSTEDQQLFDDILLSYEAGMVKPAPEIFKMAANRLGVEIDECVMIDDSIFNCEGAGKLGMKQVVYKDFSQFKSELETILANTNN